MRVLVGCEFSGTVRDAFASKQHEAWSCDLLPSSGNHYQQDVCEVLSRGWDLIILHPPCTALAVSGNAHYGREKPKHNERLEAISWTLALWELAKKCADKVALENPVGVLPLKPAQYIQPWEFGHGETKKTGLWLYNLPPLMTTVHDQGREQKIWKMGPSKNRAKLRSITYSGIAEAMADQWGDEPIKQQEQQNG